MRRALSLLGLLLLDGCASQPQYITAYRYTPPASEVGRACVARCASERSQCVQACTIRQRACVAALRPEADKRYHAAVERYGAELQGYARALDQYRNELWLNSPGYWYGPWPDSGWWGYPWGAASFPPPAPPPRPDRQALERRLIKERCPAGCGCGANYDACFLACGGTREIETRCVGNCPRP